MIHKTFYKHNLIISWSILWSILCHVSVLSCGDWGYASQQLQEWSSAGSSVPRSWGLSDDNQRPVRPGSATKNSTRSANWEWAVQEDLWPGNAWEELGSPPCLGGKWDLLRFSAQTPLEYSALESGLRGTDFLKEHFVRSLFQLAILNNFLCY